VLAAARICRFYQRFVMQLATSSEARTESIHIFARIVVAEGREAVLLFCGRQDSAFILHLARKAFLPSAPPFPLLTSTTTWKFRDMYAPTRSRGGRSGGQCSLLHPQNPYAKAAPAAIPSSTARSTTACGNRGAEGKGAGTLLVLCGLRRCAARRGKRARQGAYLLFPRGPIHRWTPSASDELWRCINTRKRASRVSGCSRCRTGPARRSGQYIHLQNIPTLSYFGPGAHRGARLPARMAMRRASARCRPGDNPSISRIPLRRRCYTLTGAVSHEAANAPGHHPGDAADDDPERQAVPRPLPSGQHGKKKQDGTFERCRYRPPRGRRASRLSHQHHHHINRCCASSPCGSVDTVNDPDRSAAVRQQDHLLRRTQLATLDSDSRGSAPRQNNRLPLL